MEPNREKLRSKAGFGGRRYRYVGFEADGEPLGGYSFVWAQRPIAVQRAEMLAFGLYDAREDAVIVEPDVARRVKRWQESVEGAKQDLATAEEKLRRIAAANPAIEEVLGDA